MRTVPQTLTNAWRTGNMIGASRAIARVTVQQSNIKLYRSGQNTYASLPFGASAPPKELPNVKSVTWDRDVDAEVASCTVELYNTKPLPLGETVASGEDFDQPGWYTPNRGAATASTRWGHVPNEWANLLLPDNIIRTYEGYGFNPDVCPDKDEHLVQTGAWLIDEVTLTADGVITLTCRDFGRLLIDHIAMQPVIPEAFYPLRFSAVPKVSGIKPPQTIDREGTNPGDGPDAAPTGVQVTPGNGAVTASWDAMPPVEPDLPLPAQYQGGTAYKTDTGRYYLRMPDGKWYRCTGPGQVAGVEYLYGPWQTITDGQVGNVVGSVVGFFGGPGGIEQYTPRYECIGFRVYIDGVLMPITLDENQTTVTIPRLLNGALAYFEVAAIYQELNTGKRYVSARSEALFFSPRSSAGIAVDPFSVTVDTPTVGDITWGWTAAGNQEVTWKVALFTYTPTEEYWTYELTEYVTDASGVSTLNLQGEWEDLHKWNIAVWPEWTGVGNERGPGGWVGRTVGGEAEYLGQPAPTGEPEDPPTAEGRAAYVNFEGGVVPAKPTELRLTYSNSSNTPYVGVGGSVHGHKGEDAFDGDTGTGWLSVGNSRPDAGYAYEWIEGKCAKSVLTGVAFRTRYSGQLFVYVSLFADGKWITNGPSNHIPYDPNAAPAAPNGANIPHLTAKLFNVTGVGDLNRIDLHTPVANVTKVRLTFYNLPNTGIGTYPYRAQVAEMYAWAEGAAGRGAVPTPVGGEIVDETGSTVKHAEIIGGAGDNPGTYEDYTDIVKLLCAWGGFFWPEDGKMVSCDGSQQTYTFGQAPYNLGPNIDPVLGGHQDNGGGRVWGDFEVSGTAGVADLTPSTFDKKPLMDGIAAVRDILGFLFYVDEEGAVVFRSPNIFSLGNWIANRSSDAGRTLEMVTIDEQQNLLELSATLSSRNIRERVFVGTPDGKIAGMANGVNPNPAGWRRVAGWTDVNFATEEECQVMADMITLRQMFTYRGDTVTIPGYPRIQINDQVRIYERTTSESYVHYVKSISSSLDMETGEWTYSLGTHWLGERPFDKWAFRPSDLLEVTKRYLREVRGIDLDAKPSPTPPKKVPPSTTFPEYGGA